MFPQPNQWPGTNRSTAQPPERTFHPPARSDWADASGIECVHFNTGEYRRTQRAIVEWSSCSPRSAIISSRLR